MAETVAKTIHELAAENEILRVQLAEAQEVIRAIQSGEVDAVVVSGPEGEQVFTLRGAEYSYRALVESMNEGAASLDPDGTVLYCNQRLADLCGVPLQRIIGQPAVRLLTEESIVDFRGLLTQALEGHAAKGELKLRSGEGRSLPVYVSVSRFNADEPAALSMVVTDLSEQKRQSELLAAEEALRKHAELLKLSFDAIILWRIDSGVESWNVGAERLYGFTESEALGRETHDLLKTVHPKPWPEIRAELFQRGFWEGELIHHASDGREIIVSARKQIIRDWNGIVRVLETNRDITEHKKAESELKAARLNAERSEQQLRTVLDNMAERLYVCDGEGNLLIANATARRTYDPDEVSKAPSLYKMQEQIEVFDIDRNPLPLMDWPLSRVLRGETVRSCEIRVKFKQTGMEQVLSSNGSAIRDANGKIVMAVLTSEDITERKQAEEALQLATKRFEVALRSSPIVVFNQDLDLRYTWIYNPGLGYKSSDVLGKRDTELFERAEDSTVTEALKTKVIRTGKSLRKEVVIRSDGVDRFYDLLVDPLLDLKGKVAGVTCAAIDITERKDAEFELRRSKERLELALEVASLGEWEVDLVRQIASQSERHAQIFGYETAPKDWGLEKFIGHVLPEYRAEVRRQVLNCRGGSVLDFEAPIQRADGEIRWIWVRGRFWPEKGERTRMFGTMMDISERKQVEQGLIQSEKLASVGRMASSIAHEINNPLEIIGNAIFLATSADVSEEVKGYLELATQELERVTHITRQTLSFHRSEKKPTPIDLSQNIDGLLKLFAPRLKSRGIVVKTRFAEVGPVLATSGEIQQVISNLLTNSMDAIPAHGTIHIRVSRAAQRNGSIRVRLTIADTGTGIPAERLKKIFEAFFTTKEMIGTGLGLWVTKQIVEKYGAKIQVRSKVGGGTLFSVVFPPSKEELD